MKYITELGLDACIVPILYHFAFTQEIKMEDEYVW